MDFVGDIISLITEKKDLTVSCIKGPDNEYGILCNLGYTSVKDELCDADIIVVPKGIDSLMLGEIMKFKYKYVVILGSVKMKKNKVGVFPVGNIYSQFPYIMTNEHIYISHVPAGKYKPTQYLMFNGTNEELEPFIETLDTANVSTIYIICFNLQYSISLPKKDRIEYILPYSKRPSAGLICSDRVVLSNGTEIWDTVPRVSSSSKQYIIYKYGSFIYRDSRLIIDIVDIYQRKGFVKAFELIKTIKSHNCIVKFNSFERNDADLQLRYARFLGMDISKLITWSNIGL